MRGTLPCLKVGYVRRGIIPAYAGNTIDVLTQNPTPADHPRVCGEHRGHLRAGDGRLGSSPRMRGTPIVLDKQRAVTGIIPAYAGNT